MEEVGVESIQQKYTQILRRAALFSNLDLQSVPDMVDKVSAIGIAREEFTHNNNDTAPFSFMVQFGALFHKVKAFDEYYNHYEQTNESLVAFKNMVYWLAASLFKLNLHMACDPFRLMDDEHDEKAKKVNSAILGVMGIDQKRFQPLLDGFGLLREYSYATYAAFLGESEAPTMSVYKIKALLEKFEDMGEVGRFVGPATMIALGYTQSLFTIGTTKDLAENLVVTFSVEREQSGYKKITVVNAFHNRFSKYAAAYGKWYALDNKNSFTEIDDVGEYNPKEQIVLEMDNHICFVQLPGNFMTDVLGSPLQLGMKVMKSLPSKRLQAIMFPIF